MLAAIWLAIGPRTPDLAAQVHRASVFASDGLSVWDNAWYAGHHLPGYSLVFPAVAATIGVRAAGALAAVLSAALFNTLVGPSWPASARWWFAVGCSADLLVGRLTYALGVAFGLAALTALVRARSSRGAAVLAVACAATSPVAGLFLALAAGAIAIAQHRRDALVPAAASTCSVLVLAAAFPEGGTQPFTTPQLLLTLGVACGGAAVTWRQGVLRWPLVIYVVAVVASFVIPTPMGGNIERLGATFAAPLLLAAAPAIRGHRRIALMGVLAAAACWQWIDPFTQAARGWRDPAASAAYYQPVVAELHRAGGRSFRVEVPFTRTHWESAYLAADAPLARGWERQLDRRLNPLFYRRHLGAVDYHRWLRANAVRYVALPDVAMDPAGQPEAQLVRQGLPFLRLVWHDAHWRLYRLRDALPLASPRIDAAALSSSAVVVTVRRPGAVLLRVNWTPYWQLTSGAGCLYRHHGWTGLMASRAGTFVLQSHFSPRRLLLEPPPCRPDP